jgi:tripartite-type tricarboxylate transporter receptor subunit TctC
MRFIIALLSALLLTPAFAQWQPTKPINVIMNMPAGSASDNAFRIIAKQVEINTGVAFIVNYRLGAGGTIGTDYFVKSAPDGYTTAQVPIPGLTATDRMVNPNKTYTTSDFIFVIAGAFTPMAIIANVSDPVNSFQDVIKILKTEKTTVGDPGSGGRIAYELIRNVAQLEESINRIVRVEYKGPVDVVQDVAANNLRFGVVPLATASQLHISGKIKIIAITSENRSQSFPDIPTVSSVYPSMIYNLGWAVALPKETPQKIVDWYHSEFLKATQSLEVQRNIHTNFFFIDKKMLNSKDLTAKIIADEKLYAPIVDKVLLDQRK